MIQRRVGALGRGESTAVDGPCRSIPAVHIAVGQRWPDGGLPGLHADPCNTNFDSLQRVRRRRGLATRASDIGSSPALIRSSCPTTANEPGGRSVSHFQRRPRGRKGNHLGTRSTRFWRSATVSSTRPCRPPPCAGATMTGRKSRCQHAFDGHLKVTELQDVISTVKHSSSCRRPSCDHSAAVVTARPMASHADLPATATAMAGTISHAIVRRRPHHVASSKRLQDRRCSA